MPSLYIHIPFCKKACHYCSFYFTLSTAQKDKFIQTLCKEIQTRKSEFEGQKIDSIYFGGGTPTMLSIHDFELIFSTINENYTIEAKAEISLESNPENLSETYLRGLKNLGFNRLSIGVQSFFDEDLELMNRNHKALDAEIAIQKATNFFENVSIDLMFGLPFSGMNRWQKNLKKAVELNVKHISTYNLTIEEKTALARKIKRNELAVEEDSTLNKMYFFTLDFMSKNGFTNYEISNFGKENYWSKHNIGYWKNEKYIGFGPSAHSYDGEERRWNISNLNNYLTLVEKGDTYWGKELLSTENKYNEYILTSLRTIFGVDILEIKTNFGEKYSQYFEENVLKYINEENIINEKNRYTLTPSGKVIADAISSDLMM